MKKPAVRSKATVCNIGYEAGEVVRNISAGKLVISTFRRVKWIKSNEQFFHRETLAVGCCIERSLLDFVLGIRWNAQCMIDRLVNAIHLHRVFNGLARTLVGGFAVDETFFDAATEHEH